MIFSICIVMATIALLLGGAVANALAFGGSNYLFSTLRSHGVDAEKKRHDLAIERLQTATVAWSHKRAEHLDWLNAELRRQGHAEHTFQNVDAAMREYAQVFPNAQTLTAQAQPHLSDFYTPSNDQKDRELMFILASMLVTGVVAYKLLP